MDKKILLGFLGLVILIAVFLNLPKPSQEETPKVLTEEEVKEIRYEATRTGDISLCEQLQDKDKDYCRYVVFNAEAGRKQDQTICDGIEDEDRKISCKDNVIITQAMNQQNLAHCESMIDKERVDYCKEQVRLLTQ